MPETLQSLARNTHRIALAVATVVALGVPVTIYHLAFEDLQKNLQFKARVKASALSGIIASNPETWKYAENRLQGLISREPVPLENEYVLVLDSDGQLLTEAGEKPLSPLVSASHALHDAGQEVGHIVVVTSIRHLMEHTLYLALASLLLGIAVYIGVKLLPLRALRAATAAQQTAESALSAKAEREQQLQEAQGIAHLGSYNWIPQTDELYWSEEHFRLWGLAPNSIKPDFALFIGGVHPDDRGRVNDLLQRTLRGESAYECDHRVIWPDGSVHHIHGRGSVSFNPAGQPLRMIGTVTDITAYKQIEDALQTLNNELESRIAQRTHALENALSLTQATLESTENGILVIDKYRRVTIFNRRFGEMWQIPPALLEAGKDEEMLDHAIDQLKSPSQFIEKIEELYANPEMSSFDVIEFKDGRVFERHSQPQQINDEVVGRVWSFLDITERRNAEAELRAALVNLDQARASAERANEAKGAFLAHMSHEIRTPLNGVIGLARIGVRENLGRKTGNTCGRIVEAGEQLLRVVNDILDFSKIEAGKLDIETQPFRLTAVTEQAIGMVVERAKEKGIGLVVEDVAVPPAPTFVIGDQLRLRQILINLLSNSVKFTEHGEIRLIIDRDGEKLLFRVRDSGIGIAPEVLARLFQPFEQADGSMARKYGGTGLGLTISSRLAEMMGGAISVTSTLGQGSEFVLELPLPETSPVTEIPSAASSQSGQRLAGLRVLAADDVEVNQLILGDLLQMEGASVLFAADGESAVKLFASHGQTAFDVVLMDIQMPGMDGYEATCHIHELAPDMPVIGLTAHALVEERERCLAAGMLDHVTKPIAPDVLVAAILACVRKTEHQSAASSPSQTIDHAKLRQRYAQRDAFIAKLLTSAEKTLQPMGEKLRHAADAGNHETLQRLAHAVKGLAGNLEAARVASLAKRAEESARACSSDAPALGRELADMTDVFVVEIRAHV